MKQGGQTVSRQPHKLESEGSIPSPATNSNARSVFSLFAECVGAVAIKSPRMSTATAPFLRFARWYWCGLCKLPAFTAGYVCGCIVVAVFMSAPALARAVLAVVP